MKSFFPVFLLSCSFALGQTKVDLPPDFRERAFQHVQDLVSFGIRNAGTKSEQQTVDYLLDFYKNLQLNPRIDTFGFEYFSAKNISVIVDDQKIIYKMIYFNPYKNPHEITGRTYCFTGAPGMVKSLADSMKGRIIFTDEQAEIYRLARCRPIAIIITENKDLKNINNKPAKIYFDGQAEKKRSFNISCSIGPKKDKEIILGAHWDSFCGPGADDNASGVSVIMELSRFFLKYKDSLPYSIRVVFFGAEELGLLGSKAYTDKHIQDTSSTVFYFNLDSVGDTGAILVDAMTGQKGKCLQPITDQIRACRDFINSWTLLDPDNDEILYETDMPAWLNDIFTETLNSTHHEYRKARYCGSDHNSFANKGFITAHMGFDGNNVQHCPADNIKQVSENSLELAGKVAATVIINAMKQ
jgi:hypothetical protein